METKTSKGKVLTREIYIRASRVPGTCLGLVRLKRLDFLPMASHSCHAVAVQSIQSGIWQEDNRSAAGCLLASQSPEASATRSWGAAITATLASARLFFYNL